MHQCIVLQEIWHCFAGYLALLGWTEGQYSKACRTLYGAFSLVEMEGLRTFHPAADHRLSFNASNTRSRLPPRLRSSALAAIVPEGVIDLLRINDHFMHQLLG